MKNQQNRSAEDLVVPSVPDPLPDDRCIVCDRPSGGKAICADERCAQELARAE